jgi:hypothetical protein
MKTVGAMKTAATMRSRAMKTADAELLEILEIGGRSVTSPTAGAELLELQPPAPSPARRPDPAVLCKLDDRIPPSSASSTTRSRRPLKARRPDLFDFLPLC